MDGRRRDERRYLLDIECLSPSVDGCRWPAPGLTPSAGVLAILPLATISLRKTLNRPRGLLSGAEAASLELST
jgi:hypothetical protein